MRHYGRCEGPTVKDTIFDPEALMSSWETEAKKHPSTMTALEGKPLPTLAEANPAPPQRPGSLGPRPSAESAGASRRSASCPAAGLVPAAPHASGRLSLCFGREEEIGSVPPDGPERPNQAPRAAIRTAVAAAFGLKSDTPREAPEAVGTDRRREAPGSTAPVSLLREAGSVGASVCVIGRRPPRELTIGQLRGKARWDTAGRSPRQPAEVHRVPVLVNKAFCGFPGFAAGAPQSAASAPANPGPLPAQESNGASCGCEHSFIYKLSSVGKYPAPAYSKEGKEMGSKETGDFRGATPERQRRPRESRGRWRPDSGVCPFSQMSSQEHGAPCGSVRPSHGVAQGAWTGLPIRPCPSRARVIPPVKRDQSCPALPAQGGPQRSKHFGNKDSANVSYK
ncbi:uncharacterized protein LOC143645511 [Tamandua tetradactyla]|uniref:uncharacterized protein LOC143645511 n=1 Tax=Tamandua tetradactyla TaxID=48850 RepID=UPI004053A58A